MAERWRRRLPGAGVEAASAWLALAARSRQWTAEAAHHYWAELGLATRQDQERQRIVLDRIERRLTALERRISALEGGGPRPD